MIYRLLNLIWMCLIPLLVIYLTNFEENIYIYFLLSIVFQIEKLKCYLFFFFFNFRIKCPPYIYKMSWMKYLILWGIICWIHMLHLISRILLSLSKLLSSCWTAHVVHYSSHYDIYIYIFLFFLLSFFW